MAFQTLSYFLFLAVVVALYYATPGRARWALLLAASYAYCVSWNAAYTLLMLLTTAITFFSGLWLQSLARQPDGRGRERLRKLAVALSFALNLGLLAAFKYADMLLGTVRWLGGALGFSLAIPGAEWAMPAGISFYTFQALSYTMDVYRGRMQATRHFGKYALFVSFFPCMTAGPIERAARLMPQTEETHRPDFERMRESALLILSGLCKKLLIADRLSVLVNLVYDHAGDYGAPAFIVATVCFAFQIYCDFSGYSDIAAGSAGLLGFRLTRNFDRPYLARSSGAFWRKWHISLSGWFRDYLYIPLGGSRVSGARWALNTMIVFAASGLWHGADWTFVLWGLVNGMYLVLGKLLEPIREKALAALRVAGKPRLRAALATVTTFALTCAAWALFRANSLKDLALIGRQLLTGWELQSLGTLLRLVNGRECVMIAAALLALIAVEWAGRERGVMARLFRRPLPVRWLAYLALLFALILFGKYNESPSFLYFRF